MMREARLTQLTGVAIETVLLRGGKGAGVREGYVAQVIDLDGWRVLHTTRLCAKQTTAESFANLWVSQNLTVEANEP